MYVRLSGLRARRLTAQTTHMFALCSVSGANLVLQKRRDAHAFEFRSVWQIALFVSRQGAVSIFRERLTVAYKRDASITISDINSAPQVHPVVKRAKANKPNAEARLHTLDKENKKKRQPRPRTGGLRSFVARPARASRGDGDVAVVDDDVEAGSSASGGQDEEGEILHEVAAETAAAAEHASGEPAMPEPAAAAGHEDPDAVPVPGDPWIIDARGWVRFYQADGTLGPDRGRLTGPFGTIWDPVEKRYKPRPPHGLSWAITCKCGHGSKCRLTKTNQQLRFHEKHLVRWLYEGRDAANADAHKALWKRMSEEL